jgi:L-lactate dehydrogenase complex protein LldE
VRVALFATCLGDQFFAGAVADAVRLLRSLGVEVDFPEGQTCCGQPAYNAGYRAEARRMAEHTREVFAAASHVVLPSGSCTAMMRVHYPGLANDDDAGTWAELGTRTFELAEFLVGVLGARELGTGLRGMRVACHPGCHALRELEVGDAAVTLLQAGGATVVPWDAERECCGFGGLFAVKLAPVSVAMADQKLDALPPIDCLTSADGGCLLHLAGRMSHRGITTPVRHLASLLWQARQGA